MPLKIKMLIVVALISLISGHGQDTKKLAITIENNKTGAPITMGIPFPKGELHSVDRVRLLTSQGKEIPCQTTKVTSWLPADPSVKWMWLFFFTEETSEYTLEYGPSVRGIRSKERVVSINNMRPEGGISIDTGPLSIQLNKQGNGFLDRIHLDADSDGVFAEDELIASSVDGFRGSFLDLLDDAGVDSSKATIHNVFREKGSGPMHVIFRVEGTYVYNRDDNNLSPFTMRIHAYAGKSYIKVLHTLTYTGLPDKHEIQPGEHSNIATQGEIILSEETANDPGWTQPNDRIAACGLSLTYLLNKDAEVHTSLFEGEWYDENAKEELIDLNTASGPIALLQNGPEHDPQGPTSSPQERITGFSAKIHVNDKVREKAQKAKGWIDISDSERGISVGIKNFLKEYPKELQIDSESNTLTGYIWPSSVDPMSFERNDTIKDGGMLGNFAQGITKTTEFIYYFHKKESMEKIAKTMEYCIGYPVAHAAPQWYTDSKVYGNMAPFSETFPEYENALQYRYDWWAFNQRWEPWYGMFNYGDGKSYYFKDDWYQWTNNEPTTDFMLWTNFMRTGNAKYHYLAQNLSRHTMDVDNVHWPKKRTYLGANNDAIDFWNYENEPESSQYLGIGRRHAKEHWHALLSAHVWVQGWIADYYLTADHRALEVAQLTGDSYVKRIWGQHDLRGRRLYLSVLNLVELYDATKIGKYGDELRDRVNIMLELQKNQGDNLVLDRYGYSQTYVAQGLYKYYQLTNDELVKEALIDHARWVRDVPPLNHEMESYLATIYPLLIGYEFTENKSFLNEAIRRSEVLKVSKLPKPTDKFKNQKEFNEVLLKISKLPKSSHKFTNWETNQGLRVFGWTHAYNIPYLLYWLDEADVKNEK